MISEEFCESTINPLDDRTFLFLYNSRILHYELTVK